MKAYFVWTVVGPQIFLTSCDLEKEPGCLAQTGRGIDSKDKFVAYEIPLETVKQRYGEHFEVIVHDPNQTDLLRVLDSDGERVLNNIHFRELGQPVYYEPEIAKPKADRSFAKK